MHSPIDVAISLVDDNSDEQFKQIMGYVLNMNQFTNNNTSPNTQKNATVKQYILHNKENYV